jgi:hypothetical protein
MCWAHVAEADGGVVIVEGHDEMRIFWCSRSRGLTLPLLCVVRV